MRSYSTLLSSYFSKQSISRDLILFILLVNIISICYKKLCGGIRPSYFNKYYENTFCNFACPSNMGFSIGYPSSDFMISNMLVIFLC